MPLKTPLNFLLLSIFSKNANFRSDVKAFRERYQVLTVIYANFCFILMITAYEAVATFIFGMINTYMLTLVTIPSVIASFIFLKKGQTKNAAIMVLVYMHFINFSCSYLDNGPMVGLYGLMTFPYFAFFMTSSKRVQIVNASVCGVEYLYHGWKILNLFQVTFTEEQSMHIITLMLSAFIGPGFLFIACFLQKDVETNVWNMAQSNYEKSENLTREILHMMNFNNERAASWSYGVENQLKSLNEGIDYVLGLLRTSDGVQILKNLKLSSEIISEYIYSGLKSVQLKIEGMKFANQEVDLADIMTTALNANAKNMNQNQIMAQVAMDDDIPSTLRADPTNLLHVLLNTLSYTIKSATKKSEILLRANWCSDNQNVKQVLLPKEDFDLTPNSCENEADSSTHSIASLSKITSSKAELEEFFPTEAPSLKTMNVLHMKGLQEIRLDSQSSPKIQSWTINKVEVPKTRERFHNSSFMIQRPNVEKKGYLRIQLTLTGDHGFEDNIEKAFEKEVNDEEFLEKGIDFGLWSCRQFCRKMGGDMRLYKKPDNKIAVVFCVLVDNGQRSVSRSRSTSAHKNRIRAMVVDGYASNQDLLKILLREEGIEVSVARTGEDAVERYKAEEEGYFDFVIMDVHVPKIDGFTSAKMMRDWDKQHDHKKIDIYFTSDHHTNEEELLNECKVQMGINHKEGIYCLKKPFSPDEIKIVTDSYKNQMKVLKEKSLNLSMNSFHRTDSSHTSYLALPETGEIRNRKKQVTI